MKKFTRLMSLLLCAVLLCTTRFPVAASAAEIEPAGEEVWKYDPAVNVEEEILTVEEIRDLRTLYAVTDMGNGECYIGDFADLKEALAMSIPDGAEYFKIMYDDLKPLTVTQSITVPAGRWLQIGGPLVIAKGATVTLEKGSALEAEALTVDGNLDAKGYVAVQNQLIIKGSAKVSELDVFMFTQAQGLDKLQFQNGRSGININGFAETAEEFYQILPELAGLTGDHYYATLYFLPSQDVVLDRSFTVPEAMTVDLQASAGKRILFDSGITVTVAGNVYCASSVELKGTVNTLGNGIFCMETYRGGKLKLSGGKAKGNGVLLILSSGEPVETYLTGYDSGKYDLVEEYVDNWFLHSTDGLTRLADPPAPEWGTRIEYVWNGKTKEYDVVEQSVATSVQVKGVKGSGLMYVELLVETGDGVLPLLRYSDWIGENERLTWDFFQDMALETGTYYVSVRAIGDYISTSSSNAVISEKFVYTKPVESLKKITNVKIQGDAISWDASSETDKVAFYKVEIFIPGSEGQSAEHTGWSFETEDTSALVPEYIKELLGAGEYILSVSAVSKEPAKIASSEPAMSKATKLEVPATRRYAGANRFETSFLVADAMKQYIGIDKFGVVIVASGVDFADALAGSYMSASYYAPILLSYEDAQNKQVKEYIKANVEKGGTVCILGGENAVPKSMETGLEDYQVIRLAGDNRFLTNLEILKNVGIPVGGDILVATGTNFADCLSASAAGKPILLVYKKLTKEQEEFLAEYTDKDSNRIVILGGTSAVDAALEQEFKNLGYSVKRLAGENRFETSTILAKEYFDVPSSAVLAYAGNFPDGLCGGGLAFIMGAPLILTMDRYEQEAADYVKAADVQRLVTLGGTGLISDKAANKILGK